MIDITKLSPGDLDRFLHMQALIARQAKDAAKVRDARDYYAGEHPTPLTKRQREYLGPLLTESGVGFNHNLVKVVIDRLRERISLSGFTVNGESAAEDGENADQLLAHTIWQWWTASRMERQQIRLHRRTLRDGKSYIMVDYDSDNQRPRITLHEVDNGTVGIQYHRDPSDENRVLFATRYFYTFDPLRPGHTGIERKTVYLPDQIRKYRRPSGQSLGSPLWEPTSDPEDNGVWPLPWVDNRGKPLGVAVIEFRNPGGSEALAVAGLQNALNKAWLDLLAAADTSGFPILTMNYTDPSIVLEEDDDANLEGTDEFKIGPGRALEIFGGKIDRIPASSLDPMIETLWTIVAAIGGVTSTPQFYLKPILGVDVPSGEALKQLEAGLVQRAKERMLEFGESWEEVMELCVKVDATFGKTPMIPEPLTISTQWVDPNTRIEDLEAQTAAVHDGLGVPKAAVWAKLGYSPEQIAAFREEERAAKAAEVATIAGALQARENRNQQQVNPEQGVA